MLVVEDDPQLLHILEKILKSQNYNVLAAPNAEEAMDMMCGYRGPLDLILTDLVMPGLDGAEMIRQLMLILPEAKIIYMSGYEDSPAFRKIAGGKNIEFFKKPFETEELVAKVRRVLDGNSTSQ